MSRKSGSSVRSASKAAVSKAAGKATITKRYSAIPVAPAAPVAAPVDAAVAVAEPVAAAAEVVAAAPARAAVDQARQATLLGEIRRVDADAACQAAVELGTMRDAASVDALIEVVANADGYFHGVVRAAAASSLAALGDRRAVDALIGAVRDPMAEASAEAVRALAVLADARAIPALAEVVSNANGFFLPVVRLAAVHALGTFADPKAAELLASVAANAAEDAVIRHAAGK